ncbi:DUF2716 domain-containing protein [Dactylosporangium sp. CA-233914]|uniref:DUF2716 domain-containing protein n=1 Tax=Dactylosporangium sp. CA-233914 TaxID=3239934 RepID=UPI003D9079D2
MAASAESLLGIYDAQLRARIPPPPLPLGTVYEQDGPVVRAHYGTHGTVEHRGPLGPEPEALIRRQQAAFAARSEPAEWRVHASDPPELPSYLVAAGFTPGWDRHLLIADIDTLTPEPIALPAGQRIREVKFGEHSRMARVHDMAAASGPHRTPLNESDADGDLVGWGRNLSVVEVDGRARAAGWVVQVAGTEFVSIGGMTAPEPAMLPAWVTWNAFRARIPGSTLPASGGRWRYLIAEADGELREMLVRAGFQKVTTVQSYHWSPPGRPAEERPVVLVFDDPAGDAVWRRFLSHWAFSGDSRNGPPTEPPDSVTWQLSAIDGDTTAVSALERIVQRGLRLAVHPGERVYALNAYTQGYHFDPRLTGGPGQPPPPRCAYPDRGDDRLYTTADLRTGTYGDPWEASLCVFGTELLREVEADLTALLGVVLRRGGRPVGNVWTFGPEGNTVTSP